MVQKDTFKVPSGPLIGLPLGAEGLGVFGDGACQLPSDCLIIVKIRRQATAHALHSVQRKATLYEKTYPSWWALSMDSKRIDWGAHWKRLLQQDNETGGYAEKIATHPDFKNEKTVLEHFINNRGHAFLFIPKYHRELNAIDCCWSQAKRYMRAYCNYSITGLRWNIPESFDTISVENILNYFRQARQYMYGYLLGHQAGIELEQLVKNFSKQFKLHRRVAEGQ